MPTRPVALVALVLVAACNSTSRDPSCDPAAQTGCGAGTVCEVVDTGGSICAAPVLVQGHVFALADAAPVAGARVVALDANGSAVSSVAITSADGAFSIRVANPRSSSGAPVAREVLLRADASGFRTFPSGIRQAFPVSTADAVAIGGSLVVSGDPTEIGLEAASAGANSVHGVAAVPATATGVLVVAERQVGASVVGASAIADRNGEYRIFNLPDGDYTVRAYARGTVHEAKAVTLAAAQDARVDLAIAGASTAKVSGGVQIVNPGLGSGTSVILVVESTFDEALVRGESPPGLRAPEGLVPDLKGSYEIAGVPPGRYVALAAFENDHLVRDPDVCIGGTQLLHLQVPDAAAAVPLAGFKITGSLDVLSPGAAGPETVTGTPTFSWVDDSSEQEYELSVVDSLGAIVWSTRLPGSSGADPVVPYGGPALGPGYYQFKVRSSSGTCTVQGQARPKYLAQTEDLKGVFIVP